jgi:hypothetical protein
MKRFAFAILALAGIATPAAAVTLADLTCAGYSLPLPRYATYVAKNCPANVWYVCQAGTSICCDKTPTKTVTLKLTQ